MKPAFNSVDWLLILLASPFWVLILLITANSIHIRSFPPGLIILCGITAATYRLLKPHRHALSISCLIAGIGCVITLFATAWIASSV